MAIGAGMTCAITNPIEPEIKKAILAADLMMGHDENCLAWIGAHREGVADLAATDGRPAAADAARAEREARRAARRASAAAR
jgi:5-methyltetrahydrofolate--homocysteine methyltransferase